MLQYRVVTATPIRPTRNEVHQNRRSRSARLRVLQRVHTCTGVGTRHFCTDQKKEKHCCSNPHEHESLNEIASEDFADVVINRAMVSAFEQGVDVGSLAANPESLMQILQDPQTETDDVLTTAVMNELVLAILEEQTMECQGSELSSEQTESENPRRSFQQKVLDLGCSTDDLQYVNSDANGVTFARFAEDGTKTHEVYFTHSELATLDSTDIL